ncbi:ATP-binding protein [Constrictibacter sp. MBR-5]|uniref:ATP-binding protein n=1 Tax=Constrictibacter sp. MBR-5 TaxID=3156467 RepID=UPI003394CFF7
MTPADLLRPKLLTDVADAVSVAAARPVDVFTIVAEVFANACKHAALDHLGVRARTRGPILLIAFDHDPALQETALAALSRAGAGWLPDLDALTVGGLGLPLLHRLSRRVTVSNDNRRLNLWLDSNLRKEHAA